MSEPATKPNGPLSEPPIEFIDLTIRWAPAKQSLQVIWPNVDDVIKLGLLEFAKSLLVETRTKAALGMTSGLVIPAPKFRV